jgi:hypothetical protein
MEADWEFEIASDAPVIDAAWPGFVDLHREPERVSAISEQAHVPALRDVLLHLNAEGTGLFTSKCDVWNPGAVDADELGANGESTACALACYVDLLPAEKDAWGTPESCAAWARSMCANLAEAPVRNCRIDMVIRRAFFTAAETGIGITSYVVGGGSTEPEAADSLSRALRAFSEAVTATATGDSAGMKLQ